MTYSINSPEKPNSSPEEPKGVFEKYEMVKLNKYGIIITIAIINIATWLSIHKITLTWNVIENASAVGFTLILLGVTVGLFSVAILYFNHKTNFLLDERTKKLE